MNNYFKMATPWAIYMQKVKALFENDPDVDFSFREISDVLKNISLYVRGEKKAAALEELLPHSVEIGGVKLEIDVFPANSSTEHFSDLFRDAFKGNPAVSYVHKSEGIYDFNYVVCGRELVQYPADDLSSLFGVQTKLYEDIIRDVIPEENRPGISICTDIILGKVCSECKKGCCNNDQA